MSIVAGGSYSDRKGRRYMKIGVMPHPKKPVALALTKEILTFFSSREDCLWVDPEVQRILDYPFSCKEVERIEDLDVLIVLGGDGTLLTAARKVCAMGVPILGVNVGHLGFLTELESQDLNKALEKLVRGEYLIEERMLIDGRVFRGGTLVARYRAQNDMVITRGTFARIIRLRTFVDSERVFDYIADGLIIATPTGSTAYSLSAGGPIIEPLLDCIMITPICPHTLASRSVIVNPHAVVAIELESSHAEVMLTVDGQLGFHLQSEDRVEIVKAPVKAKFVKLRGRNFFQILNSRLNTPRP